MSYSRWGSRGSGHWYTFWRVQDDKTENRDTAIFEICGTIRFTAKELRDGLEQCMEKVHKRDPEGDTAELAQYAKEFLDDVDETYPDSKKDHV